MLFVMDVGNTNVVFACMDERRVLHQWRTRTKKEASADYYAEKIRSELVEGSFEGAILGSVVPEVNEALCAAARQVTGRDCMVAAPGMRTDMPILLEKPDTLAADIVAGCVGAMTEYPVPLAVVDMGTATTIVVVDGQGCYRGGAIAAGVKLSLEALTQGTSLLPDLEVYTPEKCIATETVGAMCSGAVYGAAAMVDGMIDRMERELGEPMTVVLTGGMAGMVSPLCTHETHCEPHLLLKGLVDLYRKNEKA